MHISFIPLPTPRLLLSALRKGCSCKNFLSRYPLSRSISLYSHGRIALLRAIDELLAQRNIRKGVVWFPEYFCGEALAPFKAREEISLNFYKVNRVLSPDWKEIEMEIKSGLGAPDVFVLVHYFGFPNELERAEIFAKENNCLLMEDAAHVLVPVSGIGRHVTVFSPRKLLPLPDGAILISANESKNIFGRRIPSRVFVAKWLCVRLFQRLALFLGFPWYFIKYIVRGSKNKKNLHSVEDMFTTPSSFSVKLLKQQMDNVGMIIETRRRNYQTVEGILKNKKTIRPLFHSLPSEVCPYVFPIVVDDNKEYYIKQFIKKNIPVSEWPDLPLEVVNAPSRYRNALWLERHVLLLPVHQDISKRKLEYMVSVLSSM